MNRYFEIALGSAYETLAGLDLLQESGSIDQEQFEMFRNKISSICNQLGGFKKVIDR